MEGGCQRKAWASRADRGGRLWRANAGRTGRAGAAARRGRGAIRRSQVCAAHLDLAEDGEQHAQPVVAHAPVVLGAGVVGVEAWGGGEEGEQGAASSSLRGGAMASTDVAS